MRTGLREKLRLARARAADEGRFAVWSLTSEGRRNAVRLRALQARHVGRRAIVMGNGPSLLKADLNSLSDEVTIVSNANYLIWDELTYVPNYLTVEDQLVVEDRAAELRALEGIVTIFPFEFRGLLGSATPSRLYVNFLKQYEPFPRFSHDLRRRAFWGGTVSFFNLQLATFLGCNPIVLIGFDHSYEVPKERSGHVIESTGADVNHIHPDYFGPGYRWHDPNVQRMELSYRYARAELEKVGVRVVNATCGGHLEVFERIDPLISQGVEPS